MLKSCDEIFSEINSFFQRRDELLHDSENFRVLLSFKKIQRVQHKYSPKFMFSIVRRKFFGFRDFRGWTGNSGEFLEKSDLNKFRGIHDEAKAYQTTHLTRLHAKNEIAASTKQFVNIERAN